LISQENQCVGKPEPWFLETQRSSASGTINNVQDNTVESSILESLNIETQATSIAQLTTSSLTKYQSLHLFSMSLFHRFNRSAIEGRVTRKSEIRQFSNGMGKFFTFDVADLHSEIRCKAFNDIVDMFFGIIITGQVSALTYSS